MDAHVVAHRGALWEEANELAQRAAGVEEALGGDAAELAVTESADLSRLTGELRRRIQTLYGGVSGWTGGPTTDQQKQMKFFAELVERFRDRLNAGGGVSGVGFPEGGSLIRALRHAGGMSGCPTHSRSRCA